MKQRFHTIIKPEPNGWYTGWVEEIPGAITHAPSLDACREGLRSSLELLLETHRDEARQGADETCMWESIEVDIADIPEPAAPQRPA